MRRSPVKEILPHWLGPAGLALAAAASPLLFSSSFVSAYAFPKFLALAAGVCLAAWGARLSPAEGASPLDRPLLACAAVLGLTAALSVDPALSLLGQHNLYAYGLLASSLLLAATWLSARLLRGSEEAMLKAVLVGYSLAGLYGLLQLAGLRPPVGLPDPWHNARAFASFGSPVSLGQGMALVLPLALHWALEKKTLGSKAAFITCAGGLYASISRGSWLAAALACGLYLLHRYGLSPLKRPRNAVLAALLFALIGWGLLERVKQRPFVPGDGGRAHIWATAWTVFRDKPLFGWGPDTFTLASRPHKTVEFARQSNAVEVPGHAHNDLLQALATTGVAGLAAYLWLLAAAGLCAYQAARDPSRPWAAALACGLLGLFLGAKFNPVPIEVLACAAVFCGLLARAENSGSRGSLLPALAASVLLLQAGRMGAAELTQRRGHVDFKAGRLDSARQRMASAVVWNPDEPSYRHTLINVLALRAASGVDALTRRKLLDEARAHGEWLLLRHPLDANSHYFHGVALLNAAWTLDAALLPAAEKALDAALALDPVFPPLLQLRRDAALSRGDEKLAAALDERLKAVATRDYGSTLRVPVSSRPAR